MRMLRKLRRDRRGLAAVEFALIAPVMIILYLGIVELSDAMIAHRKVTTAASTAADLVGQALSVNDKDMQNIMASVQSVMAPYDATDMTVRITSVVLSLASPPKATVGWSDATNMSPLNKGAAYTLPGNLGQPGGSIIVAEVTFTHDAMTVAGEMTFGKSLTFSDKFYLEPRRTLQVSRVP